MNLLASLVEALRPMRRIRAGRTFLDLIGPLKPWQFHVDCIHPRQWFGPVTFFFDTRVRAAAYMQVMREKGWDVSVHGERWA